MTIVEITRDEFDSYKPRAIHVDVSLATQEEAEAQLLAAMEEKRELR
jgi:hypothetical protein